MSKHYSKYNRPMAETERVDESVVEATIEPIIEESVEESMVVEEKVVEEPKDEVGVVVGCDRLRVRKQPTLSADILCEIPKGSAVVITGIVTESGFYPVCTETGVMGYCMKKYIKVQ